jgi:acyl-CoA reductase-like NAD-dependent aldehyde dehydrogenase
MSTFPFDPKSELSGNVLSGFYIDGQWVQPCSNASVSLIAPSTGQAFASVPLADTADVDKAVDAARRAFDTGPWPSMSGTERAACLQRMSAALVSRMTLLSRIWTAEVCSSLRRGQCLTTTPNWRRLSVSRKAARREVAKP